ncbi:MAG: NB-ARC domain-containing protein [Anaerolineae bacterium]
MKEYKKRFGQLLKKGIRAIALEEDRAIKGLQDEIAFKLNISSSSIEKWEQGTIPDSSLNKKVISYLAEICVTRGNRDELWLKNFLATTGYTSSDFGIDFFQNSQNVFFYTYRTNLPARQYTEFVGRKAEKRDIIGHLSHHRMHLVGIFGLGGSGKTTLAIEIGYYFVEHHAALPAEERFKAVVFFSAKSEMYGDKGRSDFRYSFFFDNFDNLYRNFTKVFSDTLTDNGSLNKEEKINLMHDYMRQSRILLILDNLEDVSDPDLNQFLINIPEPSKALLTSRHKNLQGIREFDIENLSDKESKQLIKIEAEANNLELSADEITSLSKATRGNPLLISVSIKRMKHTSPQEELTVLENPDNDFLEFIFEPSLREIRSSMAHHIFMGLSLFPGGATENALDEIINANGNIQSLKSTLKTLDLLSLVERTTPMGDEAVRFYLSDLATDIANAEFKQTQYYELRQTISQNFIDYYGRLLDQIQTQRSYKNIKNEIENILEILKMLLKSKDYVQLSSFFEKAHDILSAYGYWEIRHSLVTAIVTRSAEQNLWYSVARFFTVYLTSLTTWSEKVEKAEEWIQKGEGWAELSNMPALNAQVHFAKCKTIHTRLKFDPSIRQLDNKKALNNLVEEAIKSAHIAIQAFEKESAEWGIFLMAIINETAGMLRDEGRLDHAMEFYDMAKEKLTLFENDKLNEVKWKAIIVIEIAILKARKALLNGGEANLQSEIAIIKQEIQNLVHRRDLAQTHMSVAYYQYKMNDEAYKINYDKGLALIEEYNLETPVTAEQIFLETEDNWLD